MKLLLDSHVFLWAASSPDLLSGLAKSEILSERNQLIVSAASIWEITIKAAAGRQIRWLDRAPPEVLDSWISRLGAKRLPIHTAHAAAVWALRDWSNKDPFDRMLATQAIAEDATLVTADRQLHACPGLSTLWDSV